MNKKLTVLLYIILLITALFAFNKGKIFVSSSDCVGCGDCQEVCPVSAVSIIDGKSIIDPELCIQCELCVKTCTYNAIKKSNEN